MTRVIRLRTPRDAHEAEVRERQRRQAKRQRRHLKEGQITTLGRRSNPLWCGDR